MHKGSGATENNYMQRHHNLPLNREALINNSKILRTDYDPSRFLNTEAILIQAEHSNCTVRAQASRPQEQRPLLVLPRVLLQLDQR